MKTHQLEHQFGKFLEILKKVHINIPFAEALAQMPLYMKFMKEMLSNKRKLVDWETVALSEECSAIIQKKLPQKLKDPGSFSIPCTIGNFSFDNVLCDLGASVNLMPLSVYRSLGLGEPKPTNITLKLANRSLQYPYGIVENVIVKVEKFFFPVDFVILDMEEDSQMPLIFGRPFLATGRALIDIEKGEIIFRVENEQVSFSIKPRKDLESRKESCFKVEEVIQKPEEHLRQGVKLEYASRKRTGAMEVNENVNNVKKEEKSNISQPTTEDEAMDYKKVRKRDEKFIAGNCKWCKASKGSFKPP